MFVVLDVGWNLGKPMFARKKMKRDPCPFILFNIKNMQTKQR